MVILCCPLKDTHAVSVIQGAVAVPYVETKYGLELLHCPVVCNFCHMSWHIRISQDTLLQRTVPLMSVAVLVADFFIDRQETGRSNLSGGTAPETPAIIVSLL